MKPMTMLTVVALALGSASCVPDTQSVQVKYAMAGAIDSSCMVSPTETQLFGGGVDLDWTDRYWLALFVVSNVEPGEWTSGGSTVHSSSRNDFYIENMTVKYSDLPSGVSIPETSQAVSGTISAGGNLNVALDVVSAAAAEKLPAGKTVTVEVTLKGKFAHGGEYETAPFYFPLTIVRSGTIPPSCSATEVPTSLGEGAGSAPCSNWGQDGYYYYCKSTAPATPPTTP